MGIGQFTNVVGNDDVISGSFRILAMFIDSTPLLPKKILHKFSGVFFLVCCTKRLISLRFYKINSLKIKSDHLFFKTLLNTSLVLFKFLSHARKKGSYKVRHIPNISVECCIKFAIKFMWWTFTETLMKTSTINSVFFL